MGRDRRRAKPQSAWPYTGLGVEFAGAIIGFALLGVWIDYHWQIQSHAGVLICSGLGLVGGTYNFIREALVMSREAEQRRRQQQSPPAERPEATDGGENREP